MNVTKVYIDGKEYLIKDKDAQKAVEALKSQLEEVKQELESMPKLQIIEVE